MKFFICIIFLFLFSAKIEAQSHIKKLEEDFLTGYEDNARELRATYNAKDYQKMPNDPYEMKHVIIAAMVVPGGGQYQCQENARALKFLGMFALGYVSSIIGDEIYDTRYDIQFEYSLSETLFYGGIGLMVSTYLFGIYDAIELAKLKNMAYQHKMKSNSGISLNPNFVFGSTNKGSFNSGLQLTIHF